MGTKYVGYAEFLVIDRKSYRHQYYLKNKRKALEQGRVWRTRNITKFRRKKRKEGRRFRARYADQIKAYNKKYAAQRYAERRLFIDACKSRPCLDCSVEYPACVMQFDHVRGRKLFQISTRMSCNLERLKIEIAKCDVVCANCHSIRTHKRRKREV